MGETGSDAWYAILQLREFVKDAQDMLLPTDLQNKTTNMADTTDTNVRDEFRRIQRRICTIL